MNQPFPEDPIWVALLTGIFFATVGFTGYHFLNQNFIHRLQKEGQDNTGNILLQRLSGILIYGILPAGVYYLFTRDTNMVQYTGTIKTSTFYWLLPFAVVILIMNYLNAGSKDNLGMYPEIRKREWSFWLLVLSAVSWTGYLLAYEFIFRALLFIPAYELFGFWPAVILNIGIYSLVHVPKGIKEGVGAIFLGFVLCWLVFKTGSFWVAFFVHVVLALSNEWFSLAKNPDLKIIK